MTDPASLGYEAAQQQFEDAGVPFPYIPLMLRPSLVRIGDWHYATDPARAHQDQRAIFDQLKDNRLSDFVQLMHIGHGLNSWLIRYVVVLRPLLLFVERPWGGAYTSSDTAVLAETFAAAQHLIEAAEAKRDAFAPGEYLAVIDTPIAGSQWLRLTVPSATHPLAMAWHESDDALHAAFDQL